MKNSFSFADPGPLPHIAVFFGTSGRAKKVCRVNSSRPFTIIGAEWANMFGARPVPAQKSFPKFVYFAGTKVDVSYAKVQVQLYSNASSQGEGKWLTWSPIVAVSNAKTNEFELGLYQTLEYFNLEIRFSDRLINLEDTIRFPGTIT